MSTRSAIGIVCGNKIKMITCKYDGGHDHDFEVGCILQKYYTNAKTIKKLISLGTLASVGTKPIVDEDGWKKIDKCEVDPDKCIAYSTIYPKKDIKYKTCKDVDEFLRIASGSDADYAYLFYDNKWHIFE